MPKLKSGRLIVTLVVVLLLSSCNQPSSVAPAAPPATTQAVTTVTTTTLTGSTPASGQTGGTVRPSSSLATAGNPTLSASPLPIGQLLKPVGDIPLPGNPTRFDYQSLDPKTGYLFIAHLGDSQLLVFDTKTNQIVAKIEGLGGIHGVLVVPELNRVFATATADHQLAVIDEISLKVISRLPSGDYPDGLDYDPATHKLYISDENGQAEPVIDIQANKVLPSIALGGEAGNTRYDPVSGHIFVAVQSRNELVEIDPKTDKITARHPLPGCQTNHSLQIDPLQRLAFVGCEGNAKLLVLDMQDGMKLLTTQNVGATPDVLAVDSEKSLLYVACESGSVAVFNVSRPSVAKLGDGFLAASAHTIAVDPKTHRVYLPLENVGGKPVLRIMELVSS